MELKTGAPNITASHLEQIIVAACPDAHCYWHPKYLSYVWKDQKLHEYPEAAALYKSPVGLVLDGVLQVTEQFDSLSKRRRTTAIIEPSGLFGLFEAIVNVKGWWEITAGFDRILITNSIGDQRLWSKLNLRDDIHLKQNHEDTLRFSPKADFNYNQIIKMCLNRQQPLRTPKVSILLFDYDRIKDSALSLVLFKKTVEQLASFVRQNPPFSLMPSLENGRHRNFDYSHAPNRILHSELAALLNGDIPVFRPATATDDKIFPFSALHETFTPHDDTSHQHPLHVFVPSYLSPDGVYVYFHALSRKLDKESLYDVFFQIQEGRERSPYGLSVRKLEQKGYDYRAILVHNEKEYGVHWVSLNKDRKQTTMPPQLISALPWSSGKDMYKLSPHISEYLVFFPASQY